MVEDGLRAAGVTYRKGGDNVEARRLSNILSRHGGRRSGKIWSMKRCLAGCGAMVVGLQLGMSTASQGATAAIDRVPPGFFRTILTGKDSAERLAEPPVTAIGKAANHPFSTAFISAQCQ